MPASSPDPISPGQTALQVRLLGPVEISTSDGEIIDLPRKIRALFAYLVSRRGTTVPRQTLLGLFWGERGEEQARSSLRQSLSILKSALGNHADLVLVTSNESISIRQESVQTDLDRLRRGDVEPEQQARLVFLEGLSLDEPGFEDWLSGERESVYAELVDRFRSASIAETQAGNHLRAGELATAWTRLAPLDETAHRQLMLCYLNSSRSEAAIAQFEKCRKLLREQLNIHPAAETVSLLEEAKSRRGLTANTAGAANTNLDANTARYAVACSATPAWRNLISSEMIAGGGIRDQDDNPDLYLFHDPATALRACIASRSLLRKAHGAEQVAVSMALHAGEPANLETDFTPADRDYLKQLLDTTPAGKIHVSSRLFNSVRRHSPCFFEQVAVNEKSNTGVVYEVGKAMQRQPFLAVYQNTAPRSERRACSLAVAPIKTVGNDGEATDFWSEGITEDLILELSRTRRVQVSSRTTLVAISTQDAVEIGEALGVGFVLHGYFRKTGQSARLNFTLAETEKGTVAWSERFVFEFDQVFDVLDDIVARVVARIAGKIEKSEIEAARIKRPTNMTAYEYYLRGIWHHRLGGVTTEHSRKAVEWLNKAIEADPGFQRPKAMLACAWSDLPEYDRNRAAKSVREAYEADPTDPETNRIMGWVKFTHGEYDIGIRHAERSIELAPHDAYLLGRCAVMHVFNGDPRTGLERLGRALELDPFVPVYIVEEHLAAYYALDDHEKVLSEARGLSHQTRRSRYYAAASLVALGRLDAARQVIEDALADDPTLDLDYVRGQELYREKTVMNELLERLSAAGIPGSI